MTNYNVLLICGSGASSGFLAANIRKAAAARGITMKVSARSESEILNYVDDINCLLVGPHLASNFDSIKEDIEGYDIKCALISQECYAKLNGEMAIDQILTLFNNK